MLKYFYRFLIDLTNNLYISKILQIYTTSKLSRHVIPSYAKAFKIDHNDLEKPFHEYESLHHFFIRSLKKEARVIDPDQNCVISPVDAFIEDMGVIAANKNILVKGQVFSIKEMLGNDRAFPKYEDGIYIILYLSPRDYHRIHCPLSSKVISQWQLGGKSYPVNKWGLTYGKAPLSKNYRKIVEVESNGKHIAIASVGALFVNSIAITNDKENWAKGEEIGYFSFGSTVVLLFEKGSFIPEEDVVHQPIRMGQKIGVFVQI